MLKSTLSCFPELRNKDTKHTSARAFQVCKVHLCIFQANNAAISAVEHTAE